MEKNFKEGKELVLAKCSKKGTPNANIFISLRFHNRELFVANCQMITRIKNLLENPKICVVGEYFQIREKVKIFSSGKYFDFCVRKSKVFSVKNALLISIDEIFSLGDVRAAPLKKR